MTDTYRRALTETGYNAAYFRGMLAQLGPLENRPQTVGPTHGV